MQNEFRAHTNVSGTHQHIAHNGNPLTSLPGLAIPSGAMNLLVSPSLWVPPEIPPSIVQVYPTIGQSTRPRSPTGDFCRKNAHRKLVTVTLHSKPTHKSWSEESSLVFKCVTCFDEPKLPYQPTMDMQIWVKSFNL